LFFIVGHGRSGTNWLAELLDLAPDAQVEHEPYELDTVAAPRARVDRDFAEDYALRLRLPHLRALARARGRYGEVNSRLRHILHILRAELPDARYLRIFRDGRDVVRSSIGRVDLPYAREQIRRHHDKLCDDPFRSELPHFDDFSLTCWIWQRDCKAQAAAIPAWIDFEQMTSSAAYVHDQIVAPLGLDLPEETIARRLEAPVNATGRHVLDGWRAWSDAQHREFWRLCGAVMREHGLDGP
jgi:hypothetical protein